MSGVRPSHTHAVMKYVMIELEICVPTYVSASLRVSFGLLKDQMPRRACARGWGRAGCVERARASPSVGGCAWVGVRERVRAMVRAAHLDDLRAEVEDEDDVGDRVEDDTEAAGAGIERATKG